jgi:hypothetical protein
LLLNYLTTSLPLNIDKSSLDKPLDSVIQEQRSKNFNQGAPDWQVNRRKRDYNQYQKPYKGKHQIEEVDIPEGEQMDVEDAGVISLSKRNNNIRKPNKRQKLSEEAEGEDGTEMPYEGYHKK